jgi:glyoxylase-like metal-dependent hydrolase (beta-lactamase superfamily II)
VIEDGRLQRVETTTDLPLRGRVPIVWAWDWAETQTPRAELSVDGVVMFRGTGRWEILSESEALATWAPTPGADPVQVPGDRWPARVAMELVNLSEGVHLVRGVRTGFQHLVVETSEGLVVGDAPAGWVEFHQLPPSDLVPGLGISGLSEQLIEFLRDAFEGQSIAAVVLTHFHDDHAGGARAFAAAGAKIYAPARSAAFLEQALNRPEMPQDRLSKSSNSLEVTGIDEVETIGTGSNAVRLVPIGNNPHVDAMLALWVVDKDYLFVSDIHVPHSDAEAPSPERALTECWFAEQATTRFPDTVRVINSHSDTATPVSRLRAYLNSDVCQ